MAIIRSGSAPKSVVADFGSRKLELGNTRVPGVHAQPLGSVRERPSQSRCVDGRSKPPQDAKREGVRDDRAATMLIGRLAPNRRISAKSELLLLAIEPVRQTPEPAISRGHGQMEVTAVGQFHRARLGLGRSDGDIGNRHMLASGVVAMLRCQQSSSMPTGQGRPRPTLMVWKSFDFGSSATVIDISRRANGAG